MLAGGRNSRCNSLDYFLSSFFLCVSFYLVRPPPRGPCGCLASSAGPQHTAPKYRGPSSTAARPACSAFSKAR